MDTPEKTQIAATPLSKFEDSPVFNYINNLSPIKPVKSFPITLNFNPLGFSSLPSIFTSPHVSTHKESRFLRRHNYPDISKSETDDNVKANEGISPSAHQSYNDSSSMPTEFDPTATVEMPQTLRYDSDSPDSDPAPCSNATESLLELVESSVSIVQQDTVNGCLHVPGSCQTEQQRNDATGCDWDSMLTDEAATLLFFNSPGDSEALKGLFKSPFQPSTMIKVPRNTITGLDCSAEQIEIGDQSPQSGETINHMQDHLATDIQNLSEGGNDEDGTCLPLACEPESSLHRGLRRRCLDFEIMGSKRKNLNDDSNYNEKIASKDKQLVPIRPSKDSSRCILPGIGLHLNSLPRSSNKAVKNEEITSGKPELNFAAMDERGTETTDDSGAQLAENSSQPSPYLANDDFNQSSPKKKRLRMEEAGESESSCKRCNCKKSKCLKLYCECFAAGVYCIEPCACQDCFNKPIHEDTVLATRKQIESRNPLAFAPKVIRAFDSAPEVKDDSSKTPASARHKRGCNCKKSSCLKKYCECYQGGVGCSINCRCETCKNVFGRKDGSVPTETEEADDNETETSDKIEKDKAVQKIAISSNLKQTPGSAFPITPLQLSRPFVGPHPFSSKNKPSLLAAGSSCTLYNGQKYEKPRMIQSQSKLEKHLRTVPENEMPEILRDTSSPGSHKSASPNSKRITPPFSGTSPSRRKLILKSIPSFPSLTQ
ncbi:hypothetical protein ACFE04_011582 [Oxalis oulophora]